MSSKKVIEFIRRKSMDIGRRNSKEKIEKIDLEKESNGEIDNNKTNANDVESDAWAEDKKEEVEEKDHDPCEGLSFHVGVSENKNSKYRRTMEDVHTYVANFCERLDWGYFAVFDGHAGKQCARWSGSNLHNLLYENIMKDNFHDLRESLNKTFIQADAELGKLKGIGSSGCTAAVAVLRWEEEVDEEGEEEKESEEKEKENGKEKHDLHKEVNFEFIPSKRHKRILYTANVGDTRIVLSRGGKAIRLSYDHKGSDVNEIKRIYRKGGVVLGGRVNGVLAVSRSLGDVYLKEYVIGTPFTTMSEINKEDESIIIACDGLWDICSDEKAVEMIRGIRDAQKASAVLTEYAIKKGTTDNVTVMVVLLENGVFA